MKNKSFMFLAAVLLAANYACDSTQRAEGNDTDTLENVVGQNPEEPPGQDTLGVEKDSTAQ